MALDKARISGPHADDAVTTVARRVLVDKLHAVYSLAPMAAHFDQVDVEFVHKLRVATRRGHAALQLFRPLLPAGRRKRWTRQLRVIRRAAGPARNLDVLGLRWQAHRRHHLTPTDAFLEAVRSCRTTVQRSLRQSIEDVDWSAYRASWEALIARTRWRESGPEPTWSSAAVAWTQAPFLDFVAVGQELLEPTPSATCVDTLHAFRIAGKRLRYALEICESAFPVVSYRVLARRLKRTQDRLGKINDHATAISQLEEWRTCRAFHGMDRELHQLARHEEALLQQAVRRFMTKWSSAKLQQLQRAWSTISLREEEADVTATDRVDS